MPYGTQTKFFTSDTPGAPALYADAGAYVALLDAVLVNGYGAAVINQIVVTDGMAVATTTLGHKFRKWQVALNADAGHAGLNGEFRIIALTGSSYTFEAAGVPNGTYNGGSTKVAPLGFEIQATAANQRIYRSKDPRRNAVSLFVDDTNTVSGWNTGTNKAMASVRLVSDVIAIDSFTTLGTTWWYKSAAVSGTVARPWIITGDALGFYSAVDVIGNGIGVVSNHFIQLNTRAAGDQYATMLEGAAPSIDAPATNMNGIGAAGGSMNAMNNGTRMIARALAQTGVAIPMRYLGLGMQNQYAGTPFGWLTSGKRWLSNTVQGAGLDAVNPADSGFVLGQAIIATHSPTGLNDGANFTARALMPGLYSVPADMLWPMTVTPLETPAGMPHSVLLPLPAHIGSNGSYGGGSPSLAGIGGYFVELVKDWR
ncbi:hypothetical protein [Comamonas guangdongensis]|uniref:Uncharacterized protein n=1 Tax=Comamonas guangdongensis TaxID=510515 RepID=A0ABV3ZW00_9BURK